MMQILILAALTEEADALFVGQGEWQDSAFPIRRLTVSGHGLQVVTCGLGKVHAALAAGLYGGDADLFVISGTCGALNAAPGRAYWINEAVQHDYGARRTDLFQRYRGGSWPMGEAGEVHFTAMPDPGLGLDHARIASGDAFIACPDTAAEMVTALDAALVDMEVAAVAQCAVRLGRPWAAIKAVTDDANGASGNDFHINLLRAARQSAEAVERLIGLI